VVAVLAKSLARIHRANLINFGILPLLLANKDDYDKLLQGEGLTIPAGELRPGAPLTVAVDGGRGITAVNDLTQKECDIILAGGLLNYAGQAGCRR